MAGKKGLAALLVADMGKKGSASKDSAEGGEMEGEDAAAEDVMAAIKDGDAAALKDALKSFIECCS